MIDSNAEKTSELVMTIDKKVTKRRNRNKMSRPLNMIENGNKRLEIELVIDLPKVFKSRLLERKAHFPAIDQTKTFKLGVGPKRGGDIEIAFLLLTN